MNGILKNLMRCLKPKEPIDSQDLSCILEIDLRKFVYIRVIVTNMVN